MKRTIIFTFLMVALMAGITLRAAAVGSGAAAEAAWTFVRQNAMLASRVEGVGVPRTFGAVWVVPLTPSGYVVLEGDDARPPVIAFGMEDFPECPAPTLRSLLYRTPVATFSLFSEGSARHPEWETLLTPRPALFTAWETPPPEATSIHTVEGFGFAWNQLLPYNLYAPGVSKQNVNPRDLASMAENGYGLRCAVGCVATAIGQVGAWFAWPYSFRGAFASEQVADADGETFASAQTAAAGRPYDWAALSAALTPEADDPAGPEVGRFLQHWATILRMAYDRSGSGGTDATASRPALTLNMGYKVVSSETVSYQIAVDADTGGWTYDEIASFDADRVTRLYSDIRTSVVEREIPVGIGIAGHQIVCDGWAQQIDGVLSAKTCYAKLNYGWGPDSGNNGWFALRAADLGDGESVADDGKVCLKECFAILPLQCGQLVGLPAQVKTGEDLPLTWYEAPYWEKALPAATRTVRTLFFEEAGAARMANLEVAARGDGNWHYDAEWGLWMDRRLCLNSAVLLPELFKGGTSVALDLTRTLWEKNGRSLSVEDTIARPLLLLAVDPLDGETLELGTLKLPTDVSAGTCELLLPEALRGETFQLCIATGELDELKEPIDAVAYDIRSVTVRETAAVASDMSLTWEPVPVRGADGCFHAALPWEPGMFPAAGEAWLSVGIGDSTEALWARVVVAETGNLPPVVSLPERVVLATATDSIPLTVQDPEGDALTVTSYISDDLWVEESSRDGSAATVTSATDAIHAFDLRLNADTAWLQPDSFETVGRDAVLSVRVEDSAGNVTWGHTRLTYCQPDAPPYNPEATGNPVTAWDTETLDRLLFRCLWKDELPSVALKRLADASRFRYTPAELNNTLQFAMLNPRIEVCSVAPQALTFRLSDGVADSFALAMREIPVKIWTGDHLDRLAPDPALSATLEDAAGTFRVQPPANRRFFRLTVE